jgi:hypothetical protein
MTLKFCVLVAGWPISYGTKSPQLVGGVRLKLSNYQPEIEIIKERLLEVLRDDLDKDPDHDQWVWRFRTITTAGCCDEILAINFSPVDPSLPQHLYIERLQRDESIADKYIFYHRTAQHRFLLPVKRISHTPFDLSKIKTTVAAAVAESVEKLLVGVDERTRTTIEKILGKFWQDKDANGLAITLKEGTYVWFK